MEEKRLLHGPIRNGIDVLAEDEFRALRNMRLAIATNHSGLTLDGRRTIDVLHDCEDFVVDAIYTPEHGLDGHARDGEPVGDTIDEATGLPVFSLFGERNRPDEERLHGLDAMLFDIQDVGCRFYTYIATLGHLLESCAENGVRVYVLDRPNPIGGFDVEGPSSDASLESIVNYHALPIRYGLTIGELARLLNGEREIGADLRVVTMAGWQRDLWHDQTGQLWINPSPNIRDLTAAAFYPGVGLLEQTNVSVGRGTKAPFHVVGAPWIDGPKFAARLEGFELPGMRYEAIEFTPVDERYPHSGVPCKGVRLLADDLTETAPTAVGLALIRLLRSDYPKQWDFKKLDGLLARPDLLDAIEDNSDQLEDLWQPDPDYFDARAKYLLY